MLIKQFKYSADNLGYLVYSTSQGVAIDAGAVNEMLAFAKDKGIHIKYVTNTHSHHDHTCGNQDLMAKTNARFVDCKTILSDQIFKLDDQSLEVFPTPGHTLDSVTFVADDFMVTGDTLFNGTVGNCFTADLSAFFQSLKRLMSYPETMSVYAGHDYVLESMKYAKIIEPDNVFIEQFLAHYSPDKVVSTLADELKVNPYLRFNAPNMIENLKQKQVYSDSEFGRFEAIMEIY
ncbi:MAG: MBL fold metallo-hydrolase [Pseudomonadota bacterium]